MSTNKGFFKFQNIQIVRRPTRQNTQFDVQGTAEEQFQNIVAATEQEMFQNIGDNIIDEIMDTSDETEVVQTGTQVSITSSESDTSLPNVNSPEVPAITPQSTSLYTLSIEIISPQEIQQQEPLQQPESNQGTLTVAQVPIGPALQVLSASSPPTNPQTNVATPYNDALFTKDEDEDQIVPPSLNNPGRKETFSPTPNIVNTVRSAIEVTVNDLQPRDEPLIAKCGEVDLLLCTNVTGPHHNRQLREELVMLIPILYQTAVNTEGFPSLEKYLWETVGTLPHLSLLRLSLDAVFDEYPEISAIQTKEVLGDMWGTGGCPWLLIQLLMSWPWGHCLLRLLDIHYLLIGLLYCFYFRLLFFVYFDLYLVWP